MSPGENYPHSRESRLFSPIEFSQSSGIIGNDFNFNRSIGGISNNIDQFSYDQLIIKGGFLQNNNNKFLNQEDEQNQVSKDAYST